MLLASAQTAEAVSAICCVKARTCRHSAAARCNTASNAISAVRVGIPECLVLVRLVHQWIPTITMRISCLLIPLAQTQLRANVWAHPGRRIWRVQSNATIRLELCCLTPLRRPQLCQTEYGI